jgi:putative phosphoesterase
LIVLTYSRITHFQQILLFCGGRKLRIGVISDTHGLLRPEALAALAGVEHILHAGDVGDPGILEELRSVAPVTAIRGNIDEHGPCGHLPAIEVLTLGRATFYMLHDANRLDLDPAASGFSAVICGHSHQARIDWRKGVLYFNPGSAGPRRFKLPVSVGRIDVKAGKLEPLILPLL